MHLLRFLRAPVMLLMMVAWLMGSVVQAMAMTVTPARALLAPDAGGVTCVVLQPAASVGVDAYIKQDKPDERRGGDSELRVKSESGKLNRALLRFDLSGIPAGSTITSATLSLWVKEVRDGNISIRAHKLTNSWNEAQVTWKARNKAANLLWTTQGGDYQTAILDSQTLLKDTKNVWASWNLTTAVADWYANPATNYGVILEAPVSTPKGEAKFKSSDDGTAAQRPKLEVCFSAALSLAPNHSGTGVAGQTRTYAHVATIGQTTGNFIFSAVSSQGWTTRLYRDLNGNGIKDMGDTQITAPIALGPNVTFPFLVEIDIPLGVPLGTVDSTTVTVSKQGSSLSASVVDVTQVGGHLSLQPNHDMYAVAGSVLFYGHTLTNNSQQADCYAVTAVSSQGWTVLLWSDLNQNGVHETSNPNEPPLPNPVCLQPGQTQYLVAEVQVPAGAVAGTVDTTTITAYSSTYPGKSDAATDITRVFVNDPPVIDGRYDDVYRISPDATEVCYVANGVLFGKLATFYQSTSNAVYMVLAIDKDFVDNTYGANAIGWPSGHSFSQLVGSDHAQFLGFNGNDTQVLNFKIDYISASSGTPSGYRSLGLGGDGGLSQGSAAHILEWGTSLEYSLNELGYCSGGNCSGLGTDLKVDSPATDALYTPNPTYPDWIFDVIYEVKIDIAAFGAAGFGGMDVPYIHASPSKVGTNTIIAEPGVCPGEIGDTVWHDVDHDGLQDAGEPGLAGVVVRLYRDNGDGIFTAADTLVTTQTTNPNGKYVVLFDPLDGSSNIDVGVPVGTIFSVYRRITSPGPPCEDKDFPHGGRAQVAAGYILYGTSTLLFYTTGQGVHGFTLEPAAGEFLLTYPQVQMPTSSSYYSFNDNQLHEWAPGLQRYVQALHAHNRTAAKPQSLRYVGSLVADFHRNLLKGGLFMYPGTVKKPEGKLRLLYEGYPMAWLTEQAGGKASDGVKPLLDVVPTKLHQRTPLFLGPAAEIEKIQAYLTENVPVETI
jgi:fructose-1,6-bisphosphatase I